MPQLGTGPLYFKLCHSWPLALSWSWHWADQEEKAPVCSASLPGEIDDPSAGADVRRPSPLQMGGEPSCLHSWTASSVVTYLTGLERVVFRKPSPNALGVGAGWRVLLMSTAHALDSSGWWPACLFAAIAVSCFIFSDLSCHPNAMAVA